MCWPLLSTDLTVFDNFPFSLTQRKFNIRAEMKVMEPEILRLVMEDDLEKIRLFEVQNK